MKSHPGSYNGGEDTTMNWISSYKKEISTKKEIPAKGNTCNEASHPLLL